MFRPVQHSNTELTAAAVRAELAKRKINGKQLAEALAWPRTTTWRRLNGSVPFSLDELLTVADYLGIPVTELLPSERAA